MFSRSDKSDEPTEEFYETEEKQRSPMVLAALAGLLAIAGAFLLVRYLSDTGDEAAAGVEAEASREVLVVTQPIPAGTDVTDILASPTTYLAARAVPEQFVASTAITSIAELRELEGLTLSSEALAGEQLLRGRFIDRSDFGGDGLASTIERNAQIEVPEGHHTVVLPLPTDQALGGNIRGGERVSIISSFRVDPADADPFEVSVVVLPAVEIITVQSTSEIVGQINPDVDSLGTATLGDVFVTVAVEPTELTQLTFAMKYGDIILAGALPDATEDDARPITVIDTIIDGATFGDDADLLELFGDSLAEDDGEIEGVDGDDDEGADATDDGEAPAEGDEAEEPSGGAAGVQDNSDGQLGPEPSGSDDPPPPGPDEPAPAGPGEFVGDGEPVDDSDGANGALPPGN